MNYFQITFNNLEGFDPNLIHAVITIHMGVADWWHYLPSSYIVETASTSKFIADKIIDAFPGLNFIITKIDINDYNGYLDKKAWAWLEAKIRIRNIRYTPYAPSPLRSLLSDYKLPPIKPVSPYSSALLDYLKGKK